MGKEFKIYTGCMFAGKSKHLKQEIVDAREKGLSYLVIKPSTDTRDRTRIVLHTGATIKANPIQNHSDLETLFNDYLYKNDNNYPDLILADEIQFFDALSIKFLVELNKLNYSKLIATGLNRNFLGESFAFTSAHYPIENYKIKNMRDLFSYADSVIQLKANCVVCGTEKSAEYSFYTRLSPKGQHQDIIVIGGKDVYQPLCRDCYVKEMDKKGYDVRSLLEKRL